MASKTVEARHILDAVKELILHPITTVQDVLGKIFFIILVLLAWVVGSVGMVFGIIDCHPLDFGC